MSITWATLRTEIEREYDLEEETFIIQDELMQYVNDAISDVEKEIHSIPGAEKYYETSGNIALVNGTASYSLPTDIFTNKITGIFYSNGSEKYEIKPLKDLREAQFVESSDRYTYRIENSSASGTKIRLYPASRETSATNVVIYYIRTVNKVALAADVLDVPDTAAGFLKQYVIDQAANKERMMPDAPESAALKRERTLLIETLSTMIVDENSEILPDYSCYGDYGGF